MDYGKIERIAAELEQKLGLDEAGDELVDKAEAVVSDGESENLGDQIEEKIEEEKNDTTVPPEALSASEECNACADGQPATEGEMDACEKTNEPPKAEVASETDDDADAKACIASMQKLVKIAKAVKMSKDLPSTKKEEVLSKIQKASEKLRKAAFGGADGGEDVEKMTNTNSRQKDTKNDTIGKFIQLLNNKRGHLAPLFSAKGRQTVQSLLTNDVFGITVPAGKLTPLQLLHIFQALVNSL